MNIFGKAKERALALRCKKWKHDERQVVHCSNPKCPGLNNKESEKGRDNG